MKASLKWLREFVDFGLTSEEIANALTMAGLEVENIEALEDDTVLEINVTPNRPDCLSIKGIAREISAVLGLPFKDNPVLIKKEEGAGPSIEVKNANLCPRYAARVIYGVQIKPSPEWITRRLESHGIRPANNVVDITNYVLLEMGHPLHVFDLDKLAEKRIVVKKAGSTDKLVTLDNEKRTLNKDMLLIWDAEGPVAIAGVMGGLNSEVTLSTVNVLLESAYFNPASIRRTSKALNLGTEASYRFERGADINNVIAALDRTTQLIIEIAGGKTTKIADIYPNPFTPPHISVSLGKINDVLGIEIKLSDVQKMLTSIGIENKIEGQGVTVMPPSFRQDIQRDVDVIEEIARLYGYNKIPTTMPKGETQPLNKGTRWNLVRKIKDVIRKSGFSEVINYSFLNPEDLDQLKISAEDERRSLIKIKNPLKTEEETLRTTLIPALLNNIRLNFSRGERAMQFFEVSNVFLQSGKNLPNEALKMAAVHLKDKKGLLWQDQHDGFYDLKGALENLFLELKIKNYSFKQDFALIEPYLHPGKSCVININNQTVGSLGMLHPEVAQNFDVPPEINILELDIEKTSSFISPKITYKPLPRYPYIERDIAIIVDDEVTVAETEKTILTTDTDIIESVTLFDIYSGKPIPQGKKSLAFSIRYRAGDRTLTDEEVNQIHSKIIKELEDSLKAELRS